METWHAINSVRVVRTFSDEPIEKPHLERILNAGRRTGSSKNDQHWAFIVVRDREHLTELSAVGDYAGHLAGAVVAVAIITPDATGHYNNSVMWDSGRAAQNMILAGWELGIGSVPATVYDHALAARLLGLPGDRRCDFLLSFGHPADPDKLTAPNRAAGGCRSPSWSTRSAGSPGARRAREAASASTYSPKVTDSTMASSSSTTVWGVPA